MGLKLQYREEVNLLYRKYR